MRTTLILLACLALAAPAATASPVYRDEEPEGPPPIVVAQDTGKHSVDDLVSRLTDNQREYYLQMFEYAMQTLKPGDTQEWKTGTTKGNFVVDKTFVHQNTVCRSFREMVTTEGLYSASAEGVGCKRVGADGWCKLHHGDAFTCAMENQGGTVSNMVDQALYNLDETNTTVSSAWYHFWNK